MKTFYIEPPTCYPHSHPANIPHQQNKYELVFYLNWIWRRKFEIWSFGPRGPPLGPPIGATNMNNFESPAPRMIPGNHWLNYNNAFSKRRWNSYVLQRAHNYWELPWTNIIRYLHTTNWPFLDLEKKMFEICNGGHTYDVEQLWHPLPLRMIPASISNPYGRRTTDDGRRTTHDGRRTTDDARRTTDDGRRTTDENGRQCSLEPSAQVS